MLRECKIILPLQDTNGDAIQHAHKYLTSALLEHFGGYTSIDGVGAWQGAYEGVKIYYVACEDTPSTRALINMIILHVGRRANQKAIYSVWLDGEVFITDIRENAGDAITRHVSKL